MCAPCVCCVCVCVSAFLQVTLCTSPLLPCLPALALACKGIYKIEQYAVVASDIVKGHKFTYYPLTAHTRTPAHQKLLSCGELFNTAMFKINELNLCAHTHSRYTHAHTIYTHVGDSKHRVEEGQSIENEKRETYTKPQPFKPWF